MAENSYRLRFIGASKARYLNSCTARVAVCGLSGNPGEVTRGIYSGRELFLWGQPCGQQRILVLDVTVGASRSESRLRVRAGDEVFTLKPNESLLWPDGRATLVSPPLRKEAQASAPADDAAEMHCIRSLHHAGLAWSLQRGWVEDETYDLFTAGERREMTLPVDGKWFTVGAARAVA